MSRLTEKQPTTVTVDGVEYPINTGFRNCLLTWDALCDYQEGELGLWELMDIVSHNMFPLQTPVNMAEGLRQIVRYLMQNREPDKNDHRPPFVDFEQDGQMIHDAFLCKGINLDRDDLSLWDFLSHLRELPKDCMLCRVVYLRSRLRYGKLSKEEREECGRIGWEVIRLRDKSAKADNWEW